MKSLSIIVPIYNVELYVEKCLRSLENQDIPYVDYEIICINDGSPDNSRDVVISLQKEFTNIVLIDQENQGVSCARNNGIEIACGRYLLFIDPDDYIIENSLKDILENAKKYQAQVSFLGFTVLNEDGVPLNHIVYQDLVSQTYKGVEAYYLARGDGKVDPDRMWAVLFRTEFLNDNNLRYLPDVPYLEDGNFIARILCLANICIFEGGSFYQRTTRPGSATHSKLSHSKKATEGFLLAVDDLKKFQTKSILNQGQIDFLNQPILKFALLAINSSVGWTQIKRLPSTVRHLKTLGVSRLCTHGCSNEYRFYGRIYNISPYIAALVLYCRPRIKRIFKFQ